jgi:maleylacetoacetate isomerase
MHLYGYYRSSSSYRLRIALNLKGLEPEQSFIHLRKGDQFGEDYVKLNPQQQVPTLITDNDEALVQSPAILEWLDETYPDPPLFPADPIDRQRVRAIAAAVGCDIHPLGNLRVLQYVRKEFGQDEAGAFAWARHWVELGFAGIEAMLTGSSQTGRYCHGDSPTMADVYLVPQVFNSARFGVDMGKFPTIARIHEACNELDAFADAAPGVQPDAE